MVSHGVNSGDEKDPELFCPPDWPQECAPVQLVAFDTSAPAAEGPRLVLQEEAKRALMMSISSHPVRAVSVCGLYRTGKSLLLNLLAGSQGKGCFVVGDTIKACTAGIWVRASSPSVQDGSICLLLDCEGSGNTERDREHDARLFALCVLISSLLVFNSRGVISDSAIQALAVAASLAQHIHQQHKALTTSGCLSPAFLWVLRDFTLALEDTSGQPITQQDYLEQTLGRFANSTPPPKAANAANWEDQREAREKIRELFPRRDCVTLVRPVDDEEQLQCLGDLSLDQMRPKFVEQMTDLRGRVLCGCPLLRSPAGELATGGAFLALVEAHIEAMNSGSVPDLGSTWQHISQQECGRALDEGLRSFSAVTLGIMSALPVSQEEIEDALTRGLAAAKQKFGEIAMGDPSVRNECAAELHQAVDEGSERLRKDNKVAAERQNDAWLQRKWDDGIEALLRQYRLRYDTGEMTVAECDEAGVKLRAQLKELLAAYALEAVGPPAAREDPKERLIDRRSDAALRELTAWRGRAVAAAEAKAAAAEAAAEERARLEAERRNLASKVDHDVGNSKGRQEAQRKAGAVDAADVELKEDPTAAGRSAKPGNNGVTGPEGKQPKCCCAVQ